MIILSYHKRFVLWLALICFLSPLEEVILSSIRSIKLTQLLCLLKQHLEVNLLVSYMICELIRPLLPSSFLAGILFGRISLAISASTSITSPFFNFKAITCADSAIIEGVELYWRLMKGSVESIQYRRRGSLDKVQSLLLEICALIAVFKSRCWVIS